ncbi:uncharacterized protein LOC132277027 isoform X2 [Cornus florida]|uniref:uncharacterized protein LOC132277027 isoform X2 n=1 Tax=Cornus florida TaxID=4283 RepID=UPI0028968591|nr:uncharacterized protein LOC132277027 isoform X2 [Cornus florida]
MASSSQQSGMNVDHNREPGPLMKLLLQRPRGNNDTSLKTEENKVPEKDLNWYLPLHKAALRGDWEDARRFFDQDPDAVTAKITRTSETVLHIAVGTTKAIHFVEKLLELIPREAVTSLRNEMGDTALHYAATLGNVEAAKLLVAHNPDLTNTWNGSLLPLHVAAGYAHREMVSYLLTVTRDDMEPNLFADESGAKLLNLVIVAEFYDVALHLVRLYPRLATLRSSAGNTALSMLAGKPSAFPSGSRLNFWQRVIYSCVPVKFENTRCPKGGGDMENPPISSHICVHICSWVGLFGGHNLSVCQKLHEVLWEAIERLVPHVKHIRNIKLMHQQNLQLVKCLCMEVTGLDYSTAALIFRSPVLSGARLGISEIVEEILESFPPAIWSRDGEGHNIFLLAVIHRQENIYNLLHQMNEHKQLATQLRDHKENTILHLAGKLAPPYQLNFVSGAALQMQRELQWYKPDYKDRENSVGRTPALEFSEEHKDLVKEGEKWMKDAANSCTIAATLIATIAFAASITVPGGNDGDKGFPIFSKEKAFSIFAVSDAFSLFSSTASLLMFLSILTARYAEADFLYSLPKRLMIGLVTLFLSITSMMIAFSATIYLVFGDKKSWTLIPVAAFACLPVTLFVSLQFPLLVDMVCSTYCPGIFGKRSERLLY